MATSRSVASCPECCTQESEKYWRVVSYTSTPINEEATCTTTASIIIDGGCYFGTPLEVLIASVSGSITVTCPGCPPLPVDNCSGGTENYCGASTTYALPGTFENSARIRYDKLEFYGATGTAVLSFEDCAQPLPDYDVTFTFEMERCDP